MDFLSGSVLTGDGIVEGYVCIEDGTVISIEEGDPPEKPLAKGLIVPPLVNSHTHCGDFGLTVPLGMTVEELVAPPGGLKHSYLEKLDDPTLKKNMCSYADLSRRNGIGSFIDFREGGERGCRALREAAPESVILGRPVGKEYDPGEISRILETADGIGISGISDMDRRYIEKVADQARSSRKMFAIHASENVREDIDLILSFDPAFVVHMVEAADSDLLKCAESDVPIVVCAGSNRYFGKVPPIKRMLDCGVDIAVGTDNAMLCGPDMRYEASVFGEVLVSQGGSAEDITGPMLSNGRKLLYPHNKIYVTAGMAADLTVLPCPGEFRMEDVLRSGEPIFRYTPEKGIRIELQKNTRTDRRQ